MSNAFKTFAISLFTAVLLINSSALRAQTKAQNISRWDKQRLARFEKQADELRKLLKIPGMSAAIIKDQKLLWAKGFGFADVENRIPVTPDTVFHLASITKTFGATLIMQLVEQGKLSLDEPMSHYSADFKDDSVKIKHIITHTSSGTPGERYAYSGQRYGYLTRVIEKKFGKPFLNVVVETFFDPLGMTSTVPYHNVVADKEKWIASLGKEHLDRYEKSLSRFAKPYTVYGDETVRVPYPLPSYVGVSAGILSTVLDMAKYDIAIDRHVFLKKETQQEAWTSAVSNSGKRLPYGLGWFVMDFQGLKLIWHTGYWGTGASAMYFKVPEKNVSLILLANSEALIDHQYSIGEPTVDDAINNVFVCNFLRLFVFEDMQGHRLPDPAWTPSTQEFSSELTRLSTKSKSYGYDCERTSQTALATWLDDRRKQVRKAIQLDPKTLDSYVGQYQFEDAPNQILTVSREGSRLFIDWPADFKSELFPESESKFFFKISPVQLVFIKDENQVTHAQFVSRDNSRLKKIK